MGFFMAGRACNAVTLAAATRTMRQQQRYSTMRQP
jgi:hypothetical protein